MELWEFLFSQQSRAAPEHQRHSAEHRRTVTHDCLSMISSLSFSPYKADFRPFIPPSQIKGGGQPSSGASPCPPLISLSFLCHTSKCLMPLPGHSSIRGNKHACVQKRWHISTNTTSPSSSGTEKRNKINKTMADSFPSSVKARRIFIFFWLSALFVFTDHSTAQHQHSLRPAVCPRWVFPSRPPLHFPRKTPQWHSCHRILF